MCVHSGMQADGAALTAACTSYGRFKAQEPSQSTQTHVRPLHVIDIPLAIENHMAKQHQWVGQEDKLHSWREEEEINICLIIIHTRTKIWHLKNRLKDLFKRDFFFHCFVVGVGFAWVCSGNVVFPTYLIFVYGFSSPPLSVMDVCVGFHSHPKSVVLDPKSKLSPLCHSD